MYTLRFSPEVQAALLEDRPIVALESTIISHGMPYPQNVKCAREVESVVRTNGATPATIGIIKGEILVGMTDAQLEGFGQTPCEKVSRRDLSTVVGLRLDGATTVATTMLIAHMAGIKVFVTGGIGGVHRGAEESWDVSADLTELGRTPVAVVCAGAKSILDIPKTLEYLETQGVVVMGLRTRTFPAFFTPSSGLPVPTVCESELEVAAIVDAQTRLGLSSGMVVGNPVPAALAADFSTVEKATEQAVAEASAQGVAGRDTTPFLLKRINELTGGESLRANIELIKNNALVGARIAAGLELRGHGRSTDIVAAPAAAAQEPVKDIPSNPKLAVVGGAVLDFTAKAFEKKKFGEFGTVGTSVPGSMRTTVGGVGRTIAESISRLSTNDWMFETVLGDDSIGAQVASSCRSFPALLHRVAGQRSATYTAMLDGTGELIMAVADMAVFDNWPPVSPSALRSNLLLMDTNVPAEILEQASRSCQELWVEPVSIFKSARLKGCLDRVGLASPNVDELRALVEAVGEIWSPVDATSMQRLEETLPAAVEPLFRHGVRRLLVTCGPAGAVLCSATASEHRLPFEVFAFPDSNFSVVRQELVVDGRGFVSYAVPRLEVVESVTGAGDSLIAGTAWAYGLASIPLEDAVLYGLAAARLCLASTENVSASLSPDRIAPLRRSSRL